MSGQARIEVVGGRITQEQGDAIVAFWLERGAQDETEARAFVPQVMSLLFDEQEELAGTSAVVAAELGLLAGQTVWVHQPVVRPGLRGAVAFLVKATYEALAQGFDPAAAEQPVGLVQLVTDPIERRRRREAVWPDPVAHYAGYLPGGIQVRISYFPDAKVGRPSDG